MTFLIQGIQGLLESSSSGRQAEGDRADLGVGRDLPYERGVRPSGGPGRRGDDPLRSVPVAAPHEYRVGGARNGVEDDHRALGRWNAATYGPTEAPVGRPTRAGTE